MKDEKERCADLCGQIADQFRELQEAIEIICKPDEKPLLADAKVGDLAESEHGKIHELTAISAAGYIFDHSKVHTGKIIRLITTGSAEWVAHKYPDIERDLSTVREGDTVLFSDGHIAKAYHSNDDNFLIEPFLDGGYCCFNIKDGRNANHNTTITCLGIVKRADRLYTFTEAFDLLDSGKAKVIRNTKMCFNVTIGKCGQYCTDERSLVFYPGYKKHDWMVVS